MKTEIFIIPDCYLSALINNDYSGLSNEDAEKLHNWIDENLQIYETMIATMPEGESYFSYRNDIDNLGSNVYDVVFIVGEKEKMKFDIK